MRYEIATAGSEGVDSTITVGTLELAQRVMKDSMVLAGTPDYIAEAYVKEMPDFLGRRGAYQTVLSEDKSYTITITVK